MNKYNEYDENGRKLNFKYKSGDSLIFNRSPSVSDLTEKVIVVLVNPDFDETENFINGNADYLVRSIDSGNKFFLCQEAELTI